jgi:hypothetical protein
MKTVYDFITIAIFAGLIVLFLQRSVGEAPAGDRMWHYLVASVGCAVANYLGNEGWVVPAVLVIVATLAFIVYVMRAFPQLLRR